jgi:hypothetical protein
MIRAITLTSTILRLILTFQAFTCTSMLASITLENCAIPLPQAAAVSHLRHANSGPQDLVAALLRTRDWRTWAIPNYRKLQVTIGLLLLTTTAIQFQSTILVSDLRLQWIPGHSHTNLSYTGGSAGEINGTVDFSNRKDYFWTIPPRQYPKFAEYRGGNEVGNDLGDTGPTLRAFFPIGSANQRSSLQRYSGNALVLDAQVRCAAPEIERLQAERNRDNATGFDLIQLQGLLRSGLAENGDAWNVSFSLCEAALPLDHAELDGKQEQWPMSLCELQSYDGSMESEWAGFNGSTWGFLAVNTTGTRTDWYDGLGESGIDNWAVQGANGSEWQRYSMTTKPAHISLSLCYSTFATEYRHVDANISQAPIEEPSLSWNVSRKFYDASSVLQQLVAVAGGSQKDRNVMSLHYPFSPLGGSGDGTDLMARSVGAGDIYAQGNRTSIMCTYCYNSLGEQDNSAVRWVNPAHVTLFQDILKRTDGRIALAIQAHFTTLVQMVYYELLPTFQDRTNVAMASYQQFDIPDTRRGLIAATAVIIAHLVLVSVALRWFIKKTQFSLIGNAWHVAAQTALVDPGLLPDSLETVTLMTDSKIDQRTRRGNAAPRVRLRQTDGGSAAALRAVN